MKRYRLLAWLIVLTALFLVNSCMVIDTVDNWEIYFNFEPGVTMKWKYTFRTDGPVATLRHGEITMTHVGYENRRGYECMKFKVTECSGDVSCDTGYYWYSNSDDALRFVDVTGQAMSPIFRNVDDNYQFEVNGRRIVGLDELERYVSGIAFFGVPMSPEDGLEEVQQTLKYPLEIGKEWVVFRHPWLRTRRVVGEETITVPAGTFNTLKLETRDPDYADFRIYHWITGEAWVKVLVVFRTALYDENGNFLGYATVSETYELQEISWSQEP